MCPSWPATRDEKDTTRGRARVLQEMLAPGGPVNGWRAPEVHDALDLCLSCKGCSRDCPTGVDMATYKAEVLHQSYRRRLRPRPHYTLGPAAALGRPRRPRPGAGERGARLARSAGGWPSAGGRHRPAPRGAAASPPARSGAVGAPGRRRRPAATPVVLWVDSFTDHFAPRRRAAPRPGCSRRPATGCRCRGDDTCCGLTWITTGQLDAARRILCRDRRDRWRRWPTPGIPIVGVEPSCTAVLRGDALELVGGPGRRAAWPRRPARWPSCSPPPRAGRRRDLAGARGRRPAALPPRLGARLVGRRGAAGTGPARG